MKTMGTGDQFAKLIQCFFRKKVIDTVILVQIWSILVYFLCTSPTDISQQQLKQRHYQNKMLSLFSDRNSYPHSNNNIQSMYYVFQEDKNTYKMKNNVSHFQLSEKENVTQAILFFLLLHSLVIIHMDAREGCLKRLRKNQVTQNQAERIRNFLCRLVDDSGEAGTHRTQRTHGDLWPSNVCHRTIRAGLWTFGSLLVFFEILSRTSSCLNTWSVIIV